MKKAALAALFILIMQLLSGCSAAVPGEKVRKGLYDDFLAYGHSGDAATAAVDIQSLEQLMVNHDLVFVAECTGREYSEEYTASNYGQDTWLNQYYVEDVLMGPDRFRETTVPVLELMNSFQQDFQPPVGKRFILFLQYEADTGSYIHLFWDGTKIELDGELLKQEDFSTLDSQNYPTVGEVQALASAVAENGSEEIPYYWRRNTVDLMYLESEVVLTAVLQEVQEQEGYVPYTFSVTRAVKGDVEADQQITVLDEAPYPCPLTSADVGKEYLLFLEQADYTRAKRYVQDGKAFMYTERYVGVGGEVSGNRLEVNDRLLDWETYRSMGDIFALRKAVHDRYEGD